MEHSSAILLRKMDWSETSIIATWLTEHFGKVRTIARGARGPKSTSRFDLFCEAEISYYPSRKSELHQLGETKVNAPFDASKSGVGNFYLCGYFAELADLAAPTAQASPEIFDLMRRAVRHLQGPPVGTRSLLHFEKELCRALGVHDESGRTPPVHALEGLMGKIPQSRRTVLSLIPRDENPVKAAA